MGKKVFMGIGLLAGFVFLTISLKIYQHRSERV